MFKNVDFFGIVSNSHGSFCGPSFWLLLSTNGDDCLPIRGNSKILY